MAKRRGYSIRNVGRKGAPKVEHPWMAKSGKAAFKSGASRHSNAGASTMVYSDVPGRRIRKIKYTTAGHRSPSGQVTIGTGVFVDLGKGLQGRGLLGSLKTRKHLGIKSAPSYGGRHRV